MTNLDPIETAVFLNKPSKAINLLVMDLFKRGYIDIINRNPLQVKVLKKDVLESKEVIESKMCEIDSIYLQAEDPDKLVNSIAETHEGFIVFTSDPGVDEADLDRVGGAELISRRNDIFKIYSIIKDDGNVTLGGVVEVGNFGKGEKVRVSIDVMGVEGLKPFEVLFLNSIGADGTLSKNKIPMVLKSISRSLQGKVWKADIDKTAKSYTKKINEHWKDFFRIQ